MGIACRLNSAPGVNNVLVAHELGPPVYPPGRSPLSSTKMNTALTGRRAVALPRAAQLICIETMLLGFAAKRTRVAPPTLKPAAKWSAVWALRNCYCPRQMKRYPLYFL